MSTDTPETDKIAHHGYKESEYIVLMTDCARRLERERDAARARVAELEAECERLKYERNRAGMDARKEILESIKAAQHKTPLDRPDRPGWWWCWRGHGKPPARGWVCWDVSKPEHEELGKWLPATPPPVPMKEDAK